MPVTYESDMIAVPINQFLSVNIIPVDLYVRLAENKFVLIAKAGTKTNPDRITIFENKKVETVYMLKTDFQRFARQNVSIAGVIANKEDITGKPKTLVVSKALLGVHSDLEKLGLNRETLAKARNTAKSAIRLVEQKEDFANLMKGLNYTSTDLLTHSIAVSLISPMIGLAMGWQKKMLLEKLALGGLLHDIGKKELPQDLLLKPRAQMTFTEVQAYETHPFRGFQIIQSLGMIPDDIVSIVYEHHENAIGQGFPRRLRDIRINPLSKVVGLANAFANLTLHNHNNPTTRSAIEAIEYIDKVMGQPFHKQTFTALRSLIDSGRESAA